MHHSTLFTFACFAPFISAHMVFFDAYGDYNPKVKGWALGYHANTPRGNKYYQLPYQQDTSLFSTPAIPKAGSPRERLVTGCGLSLYSISQAETSYQPQKFVSISDAQKNTDFFQHKYLPYSHPEGYGYMGPHVPITSEIKRLVDNGALPQAMQNGKIKFSSFQINADGAGLYECYLNIKGDAMNWTAPKAAISTITKTITANSNVQTVYVIHIGGRPIHTDIPATTKTIYRAVGNGGNSQNVKIIYIVIPDGTTKTITKTLDPKTIVMTKTLKKGRRNVMTTITTTTVEVPAPTDESDDPPKEVEYQK
ncbi:hypothetical protein AOL_s00076g1 [Orbilia oligospora ATCC 24927]|uniref:Uncharacterized protein n=1 Tax=Arthrobotrys oligospora (strain ATCC 24927 / CBS 115.81 / DSM 1491) TaxID=756982 RepID=G1X8P5_ARTOA|nr:hypothetical protein AOL_s00076g1 [Orbilia oligospora ATCC 24927]EGX50451.1 hypothetical protein AOL_s00076g1 [Orbilia oligospora ATCC 24927]